MQEIVPSQQNQPTQWSEPLLPAKLEELLMNNDLPTIGPKSAETLQKFLDAPRPPMPEREQVDVMIAKLSLATANQKRSVEEEAELHGRGFLAQHEAQPRMALLSAGYRNRYRHPHPQVLSRLDAAGITVWRSDHDGALALRLGPWQGELQARRAQAARYWRPLP